MIKSTVSNMKTILKKYNAIIEVMLPLLRVRAVMILFVFILKQKKNLILPPLSALYPSRNRVRSQLTMDDMQWFRNMAWKQPTVDRLRKIFMKKGLNLTARR